MTTGNTAEQFTAATPASPSPRTAIVIPCYNEAERLKRATFEAFFESNSDVLFIFVNDGSKDRTLPVLEELCAGHPAKARVIDQAVNQGKAEAVRVGMLAGIDLGASYVGFWDADLATPLEEIALFGAVLDGRPDLDFILGARIGLLGRDIDRKASRHYLGRIFATGASLALNLPVYDTQCGAKLFRVRPFTRGLFEQRFGSRWIFDVELIARYVLTTGGARGIYEHALSQWHDVAESKVKPLDFVRAVGEMLTIYRTYPLNQPLRTPALMLTSVFTVYAAVGAVGTGLHFMTLIVGVELFHLKTSIAAVLGASVGALANYLMNYHMTFASKRKHTQTLPKFAVVAALALVVSGLGARFAASAGINYLVGQVACTLFVLVAGFLLNRFWTFAK
jgi:dolichyl-phosphate beta-glucosyltransferase